MTVTKLFLVGFLQIFSSFRLFQKLCTGLFILKIEQKLTSNEARKDDQVAIVRCRTITSKIHSVNRCYYANKLKATSNGYQTRGNKASYCPYRPYTISGSKCCSARGPLLSNALPVSIREEKRLMNQLLAFVESRSNFASNYVICFSNTTFNQF